MDGSQFSPSTTLGFKLRFSCMMAEPSPTELFCQPPFLFFWSQSHKVVQLVLNLRCSCLSSSRYYRYIWPGTTQRTMDFRTAQKKVPQRSLANPSLGPSLNYEPVYLSQPLGLRYQICDYLPPQRTAIWLGAWGGGFLTAHKLKDLG